MSNHLINSDTVRKLQESLTRDVNKALFVRAGETFFALSEALENPEGVDILVKATVVEVSPIKLIDFAVIDEVSLK